MKSIIFESDYIREGIYVSQEMIHSNLYFQGQFQSYKPIEGVCLRLDS